VLQQPRQVGELLLHLSQHRGERLQHRLINRQQSTGAGAAGVCSKGACLSGAARAAELEPSRQQVLCGCNGSRAVSRRSRAARSAAACWQGPAPGPPTQCRTTQPHPVQRPDRLRSTTPAVQQQR
jgi:hypothetical protein